MIKNRYVVESNNTIYIYIYIKSSHRPNRKRLYYDISRNFSPYLDIIITIILSVLR